MTAILVLLALLSIATLASRPGAWATAIDRSATPLLVGGALLCTPAGLAVLSAELIDSMRPALAVGVTWLALLTGLRSATATAQAAIHDTRATRRAALVVVVATVASVLLAVFAVWVSVVLGLHAPIPLGLLAGAGLIIGGALVGSPPVEEAERDVRAHLVHAGELVAMVCAVLALAVLPPWSPLPPSLAAVTVVGGGLLLALLQRLAGGSAEGDRATRTIAALGIITLTAGLLHKARLPSAVCGLVAGVALARTDLGRALRDGLNPTERPARIVVVFLAALVMPLSRTALLVGLLLAAAQILVQLVATSWAVGHRPSLRALANGLTSSATPVLLAASYALAGLPEGDLLLATVVVAVVVTDLLAAGITLYARLRPGLMLDMARAVQATARLAPAAAATQAESSAATPPAGAVPPDGEAP
jgi:hypothetical protein